MPFRTSLPRTHEWRRIRKSIRSDIKYLNLGEFLITVMSSLSQEESRSISENVRWGMRKKIKNKEMAEKNSQQIISLEEYRMIFGRDF